RIEYESDHDRRGSSNHVSPPAIAPPLSRLRGSERTTTVTYQSGYSVTVLTVFGRRNAPKSAQIALLRKEEQKVHRSGRRGRACKGEQRWWRVSFRCQKVLEEQRIHLVRSCGLAGDPFRQFPAASFAIPLFKCLVGDLSFNEKLSELASL